MFNISGAQKLAIKLNNGVKWQPFLPYRCRQRDVDASNILNALLLCNMTDHHLGGFAEYEARKKTLVQRYMERSGLGPLKHQTLYEHLLSLEKYEQQIVEHDQVGVISGLIM